MLSAMTKRRERVVVWQHCSGVERLLLQPALLLYITKLAAGGMLYPYGQYVHTGHRLYPYNTRSSSIIQARSKVPKSYYDPGPRGSFAEKRRSDDPCMDRRSLQCLTVVRAAAGTTEHWSWTR